MRFKRDFGIGRLLGRTRDEIDEEIRFYLEERTRELVAGGMSEDEARRAALAAFGDPDRIASRVQSVHRGLGRGRWMTMWDQWKRDVSFALRSLRRSPSFALAAIGTLALGLGATTAIYAVADGVFLRRAPVPAPESLVTVYTHCRSGHPRCSSSYPDYEDYAAVESLSGLAGTSTLGVTEGAEGEPPRRLRAMLVTSNYFELLGIAPFAGRLLQSRDGDESAPVLVLSHDAWTREWGSDPDLVGRELRVSGHTFTVVGIAPEGFHGTALTFRPDVFIPMRSAPRFGVGAVSREGIFTNRGSRWMDALVGRLAPGSTLEQLRAEMDALAASLIAAYPDERGSRGTTVESAARYTLPQFGREALTSLIWLMGAVVVLTLLLAMANVANLTLARATVREREVGVRLSLGAGRGTLARQLLVENLLVAVLGGTLGLALAHTLVTFLAAQSLPGGVSLAHLEVGLDARVLGFAFAAALVTGSLCALAPLWQSRRLQPTSLLRGEDRGRRGMTLRRALVGAQVALCVTLLVGSGLFLRTLREAFAYDTGFEPEDLALVRFDWSTTIEGPAEAIDAVDAVLERVRALPGVDAAAVATRAPLQAGGMATFFTVPGYAAAADEELRVEIIFATAEGANVLGLDVLSGMDVPDARADEAPRLVVNRTMAERYWADDPVGRTVELGGEAFEVAGVVENPTLNSIPEAPQNAILVPLTRHPAQAARGPLTLMARGQNADLLLTDLRDAVRSARVDATFLRLETMDAVVAAQLGAQQLGALLLSAFGALALMLAAVGIWGVVAFSVGQRRREVGVRIALGARQQDVLAVLTRTMVVPVVGGAAVGIAVAAASSRLVEAFLFGVERVDPATYGAITALVLAIAMSAAILPARRAGRVDPVEVLNRD